MPSHIRFYFVVLLVLLQLVAPLIHAHKNGNLNSGSSFHLPEFEQVNVLLDDGSNMIAPSFHEGEMVTISAGVKENQRPFVFQKNLQHFITFSFLFFFVLYQKIPRQFFTQTERIRRVRFLNPASFPRAPPFFTL